jgi:hypothetical protein
MLTEIKNRVPARWKQELRHAIYLYKFAVKRSLARRKAARQISRIDNRNIPLVPGTEIRGFMIVRNESLRLPFILKYYFSLGVDRIFVLDNDSSDDTRSIVLSFENTHLFHTKDIYAHQGTWMDLLLRRYGGGCWCLVVDADEMLIYPDFETVSLRQLCNFLDQESFDALDCVLLDMYPDRPLTEIKYEQGTDPLQIAPWFDRSSYGEGYVGRHYLHDQSIFYEGPSRLFGGVRKRVFDANPCVSKVPLVRFDNSMFLSPGTHFIQGARVADLRGALLHFKYLDDFLQNVKQEVARGQRSFGNDLEYNRYLTVLSRFPNLCLRADVSVEFTESTQLVNFGIMKRSQAFDAFIEGLERSVR